jgi:hypothetical protein
LDQEERIIHEQGLVSVLKQIHDDLDQAVFDAYGWPADLSDEQILERLVALNAERADEEERGLIRWLRPEFQNPQGDSAVRQTELELPATVETPTAAKPKQKTPWPKSLAEQAQAVRAALASHIGPVSAVQLAASFSRASKDRIEELLETLATLGQAREVEEGKFVG